MNLNGLAKHYDRIDPEERWALTLNAAARGDDAEAKRLSSSAPRITLSMRHDAPYMEAYHDDMEALSDIDDDDDDVAGDEDTDEDDDAGGEPDSMSGEQPPSQRELLADRCN